MKIFFFDIDGTLIRSGGAGAAAIKAALAEEFGVTEIYHDIPFSGRTDRAISHDILHRHDVEPTDENYERLQRAYLARLPHHLRQKGGTILPGIPALLERLSARNHIALGLITGNVRQGAATKLGHFGLWHYFRFGGFGDHHFDRDEVARSAMIEAAGHLGHSLDGTQTWVIGDTPLDIQCARVIGAHAVAVTTGWHSAEELAQSEPDWLIRDFESAEELLEVWG